MKLMVGTRSLIRIHLYRTGSGECPGWAQGRPGGGADTLGVRVAIAMCFAVFTCFLPAGASIAAAEGGAIRVSGNTLVDGRGKAVRLLGVNRSGTEYACVGGWGIFDGPSDAASVQLVRSWYVNTVRIGLNEDCWLAINGAPAQFAGDNYRKALSAYVAELTSAGIYVVLDLHWSAPGQAKAMSLQPMPDLDHAV